MFISKKTAFVAAFCIAIVGCSQSGRQSADHPAASSTPATVASSPAENPSPDLKPLAAQDMDVTRSSSPASCNIEAVGGSVFDTAPITPTEKSTTISGWFLSAISKKSGVPARLQLLNEGGTAGWQMPIYASIARPDVLSSMGGLDSGNVGFSQAIDLSALPAGQYQVVVTFDDAGQSYSCEKGRMIVIR